MQKVASYDELAQCLRARTPGNIDNSSTTVAQHPVITMAHGQGGAEIGLDRGPNLTGNHEAPIAAYQPVAFNWNAQAAQLPSADRDTSINGGLTCSQQAAVACMEVAGTMKACKDSGGWPNSADHAAAGYMQVIPNMQVRRLTPRECERLQGFPDDYTLIPWRNKPASKCPDGPRYKALGNSWAVPNVRWIGRRIWDEVYFPSCERVGS